MARLTNFMVSRVTSAPSVTAEEAMALRVPRLVGCDTEPLLMTEWRVYKRLSGRASALTLKVEGRASDLNVGSASSFINECCLLLIGFTSHTL